MTKADALKEAVDRYGEAAFVAEGREGVRSVGYYAPTPEPGGQRPVVLGRGRTWEAAFREASGGD